MTIPPRISAIVIMWAFELSLIAFGVALAVSQ